MEFYQGKVLKAGAYKLPEPKTVDFGEGPKVLTHRLSVQMDDKNWYGFGETDKDAFLVKDPADSNKMKVLGAGSDIVVLYELSGDGKYRNAKKGNISILKLIPGQRFNSNNSGSGNNSNSGGNFDLTGVKVGHAINAAMLLGNNNYVDEEGNINIKGIFENAKELHDISARVEKKYKELNPNMSPRDIGAASGQAILTACKLTDDVNRVGIIALNLLIKLVPAVTNHVKGVKNNTVQEQPKEESEAPTKPVEKAKTATKTTSKTATKTKATNKPKTEPKPEPKPEPEEVIDEDEAGAETNMDVTFADLDEEIEF